MRLTTIGSMAAVAGLICQALRAADDKTTLTVYMVNESIAPPALPNMAKGRAEKMLSVAGISVKWRSGQPKAPLAADTVIVEMTERTAKELYPGALAFAMPYDRTHIRVFYDRVESTVYRDTVPALLAHVLAHEIAHVLQGINRHSKEGIMKAHWDANDYQLMQSKPLTFTEEDVNLIRLGMAARVAHAASETVRPKNAEESAGQRLPPEAKASRRKGPSLRPISARSQYRWPW